MLPGSIEVGLLLLALIPGWIYLRLRERLRPTTNRSGLGELLEVLAVGLATTGVAILVHVALPPRWLPFLLNIDAWTIHGDAYLRRNVHLAVGSIVAVLLVAALIAYGLYRLERLWLPAEFRPQGSVWVHALGTRPKGTVPWVGLQLTDGRLVEGLLHSYSISGSGPEERDVALQRPIRVTSTGSPPQWLDLDRLIVPERGIAHIAVVHAPEEQRTIKSLHEALK